MSLNGFGKVLGDAEDGLRRSGVSEEHIAAWRSSMCASAITANGTARAGTWYLIGVFLAVAIIAFTLALHTI